MGILKQIGHLLCAIYCITLVIIAIIGLYSLFKWVSVKILNWLRSNANNEPRLDLMNNFNLPDLVQDTLL